MLQGTQCKTQPNHPLTFRKSAYQPQSAPLPWACSIFWPTTLAEDFCFTGDQASSMDQRQDSAHCQLTFPKSGLTAPNCTSSPKLHIPAHDFRRKFLLYRRSFPTRNLRDQAVPRTPEVIQILGTTKSS